MNAALPYIFDFFWCADVTILFIFGITSYFIYKEVKQNEYKYYTVYCMLLLVYLLIKVNAQLQVVHFSRNFYIEFNWYIQILYYNCYQLFVLYFAYIDKRYTAFSQTLKKIIFFSTIIASVLFIIGFVTPFEILNNYFLYFFAPFYFITSILILRRVYLIKLKRSKYIIIGSVIYTIFALASFAGGMIWGLTVGWFYIGVFMELNIFNYIMSINIRDLFRTLQNTQVKLNHANKLIQTKLDQEVILRKQDQAIATALQKEQQLKTDIAYLENKVLHSQINSHFIFNVLNAIKVFILENNMEKANKYLSLFAKFIRTVLDGSRLDTVSLSSELDKINNYLLIEKMRIEHRFNFVINIETTKDLQKIYVPYFMLQPIVENAIWHGIMPAMTKGILKINVAAEGDAILIQIDNNGIGIIESLQKKKKKTNHKSYGNKLIKEIIALHNQSGKGKIEINYQDKSELGLKETGTLVTVSIMQ